MISRSLADYKLSAACRRLRFLFDAGFAPGLMSRECCAGGQGVLIWRTWAYPLAACGQVGVAHMLSLLRDELCVAMALTGAIRIADLSCASLVTT
jgi:L-lactate dehydrogenase (cytochrome)